MNSSNKTKEEDLEVEAASEETVVVSEETVAVSEVVESKETVARVAQKILVLMEPKEL